MQIIELETRIAAPAMRVFLLSLSVDLHKASTAYTREQAIAGVTSGILTMNDEVTWRARHFGLWLQHAVRITAYDAPRYFRDEMARGLFNEFIHDHWFVEEGGETLMRDRLMFRAPLGILGRLIERLVLRRHLHELLHTRNRLIQQVAESDTWKEFLCGDTA